MRYTAEQIAELIKTNQTHKFYNSREWRKLSHTIKSEYHNECYFCRLKGRYSHSRIVHHVRHLKEFPELAYSRTYTDADGDEHLQLIPVCHSCHEEQHRKDNITQKRYSNIEKW